MTQKEFEERTGLRVTAEEFVQIHDIYMACGDELDKDGFCDRYMRMDGRLELLSFVANEKDIAERSGDIIGERLKRLQYEARQERIQTAEFLLGKACAYEDTDFHREAVRLVGQRVVTLMKLRMDLPLWEEDKKYLMSALKDTE